MSSGEGFGGLLDMVDGFLGSDNKDEGKGEEGGCKLCKSKGSTLTMKCKCGWTETACLPCFTGTQKTATLKKIRDHEKTCATFSAQCDRASVEVMED